MKVPDCDCLKIVLGEPLSEYGKEMLKDSTIEVSEENIATSAEIYWSDYTPSERAMGKAESRFVYIPHNYCPQCGKAYKEE